MFLAALFLGLVVIGLAAVVSRLYATNLNLRDRQTVLVDKLEVCYDVFFDLNKDKQLSYGDVQDLVDRIAKENNEVITHVLIEKLTGKP